MSSQTGLVPVGQYPPFAVVTPNDHTAWILIVTALGIAFFVFFGCIRALVRFSFGHGFGLDDYILYSATALAVVQSSIVLGACSKGLGKALHLVSPEAQVEVQKMYYASNLFLILAIGLSKISVISFLRRISRTNTKHKIAFNAAIALTAAWTLGSLLILALQCNLGHPWITVNQQCPGIVSSALQPEVSEAGNTDYGLVSKMARHLRHRYYIRSHDCGVGCFPGICFADADVK